MKIIEQSYRILTNRFDLVMLPKQIERAARTCYKSEGKIQEGSDKELCKKFIMRGHEAMMEHGHIAVKFITDRGVTHELVRHRLASFGQESTRYVKYNGDMEFIKPVFSWADDTKSLPYLSWYDIMDLSCYQYNRMIASGCSPQEARSVLPNSLKTEIVVTANVREWRHIFKLRTAKAAHPQIRELMKPLLKELQHRVPVLFADILIEE